MQITLFGTRSKKCTFFIAIILTFDMMGMQRRNRFIICTQGERRCIIIKLIINLPTDDIGQSMFDEQFTKLQAKLVAESIKKLNVDDTSKQKLCLGVLELLNNKVKEVKEND